jgi:hypothetical protein
MQNKAHAKSEKNDTKQTTPDGKAPESVSRTGSQAEGDRDTVNEALRDHDAETANQKGSVGSKN